MIIRSLSPSKLKKLVPFSFYTYPYAYIEPASDSLPSIPCFQNPTKTLLPPVVPFYFRPFSSPPQKSISPSVSLSRDGNYDETKCLPICPGCGVPMQDADPKRPGFFIKPSHKTSTYKSPINRNPIAEEPEISNSLKRGFLDDETSDPKLPEKPVVCARCHSLRHYGRVKDQKVENLLPDFDFDHTVGRRLTSVMGARAVVLMVVDASDFDGSFPRTVARLVSHTIDENSRAWKEGKPGNIPRVVLVVTKIDLLPSSISPTRLEHWVRTRAREGGANKLTSVHMVSAVREWGLKNLVDDVVGLAGPRGQVWAVGAQNAGKSTLINAIGRSVGGKVTHLTEAPVPGTTLGIVRVEGVLPGNNAKLFDTPGLLHPHQISTRLTREEQRLVHISKELKPRTYRIKEEHSVHIAGLMRIDIEECCADSIYITVWASCLLPLHMGKKENSSAMYEEHFGRQLQPPIGEARVTEMGKWVRKEIRVKGEWWDSSCVDIAAAGLGWFAISLKGEAVLGVWTYEGVDVVVRNALIPDRSHIFEVAGFTVSKIVSKADRASNKQPKNEEKKKKLTTPRDSTSALPAASSY